MRKKKQKKGQKKGGRETRISFHLAYLTFPIGNGFIANQHEEHNARKYYLFIHCVYLGRKLFVPSEEKR